MVRIYNCNFCAKEIEPGTGSVVVTRDNVLRFDSRKCKRSFEMGRDARKLKWTMKYQPKIVTAEAAAAKGKDKKIPAASKDTGSKPAKTTKKEAKSE